MAQTDLTKSLKRRFDKLKTNRQNWETHWQEVADYMLPRKADVTKTRSKGDKRTELIFDSSPLQSVDLLAASLHGMLTNPSTPWFTLRYKDPEIENDDEAKLWLESATDAMYVAFNRSNFQQEIFELYHDLITFGTACMFVQDDDEDTLKFSTRHINEIYIAENEKGKVDTVYRLFKMSVRAAFQQFGEAISTSTKGLITKDPYEEISILHAVYPRNDFDPKKQDRKNMPFESVYMEYKNLNELSVAGFKEFPFVVPRYLKASHEIYGRSPAMTALPDVKMLNEMSKTTIKAAQKQADYFNIPLIVYNKSSLPQETNINNYSVLQGQSAIAMLIQGNRQINFKWHIWGANADDSFRQRLQLRYPLRAMMAGRSRSLDLHGLQPHHVIQAPVSLFPFEWMTKSEVVSLLMKDNPSLLDLVWTCSGDFKDDIPCGVCTKCLEWKYAKHVAKKSVYKVQEGKHEI